MSDPITVVGIGADGFAGLTDEARVALTAAGVVLGSARQLALLPPLAAEFVALPKPLRANLAQTVARHSGQGLCVLASGDPMFFGIGSTLVDLLGPRRVQVIAHPSSVSLAAARLGWPLERCVVASIVGRPIERLITQVGPGRQLLILGSGPDSPAAVGRLLTDLGYGSSELTVLAELGGPDEQLESGPASNWRGQPAAALHVIAVRCVAGPDVRTFATTPGLPDEAFDHDGQLTKRDVRAITLSRLAPGPGELLWDIGAGAGSIAVEWARADLSCRAVAIERDAERFERIRRNALALGVPDLQVVCGSAPAALAGLPAPDAVFVGGGVTVPGVLDAAWRALPGGGRLVANAVTLESEAVLLDWQRRVGGELTRVEISRPSPVGNFTAWRAALPVTVWAATR
ncbi:MAG: cobL [Frankiales bacterium]|nr:cobL [Frankiales bacterium]